MKKPGGLKEFLRELLERFKADKVPQVGAQLAYYLLLSLFPLIIFILSVLSFTPLAETDSLGRMLSAMPDETAKMLKPVLLDIVASRSGGLLGLSLLLSLWSGSNGINNLIGAMDAAYDIENARKKWLRRIISVGYTIILVAVIVLALSIQVFGDQLLNAILGSQAGRPVISAAWQLIKQLLPVLIIILSLAGLYKWGPGFPQNLFIRYREALLGAAVAGILWSAASFGFAYYVNNFGNYANTYGSLGGVIILMLWLYISSVIIMLGAEVTATYISRYQGGLERKVVETILENPQEAIEAGTTLQGEGELELTVRPIRLELVKPAKQQPLHKKPSFYLGSALGGGLVWLINKTIKRRERD